MPLAAQTLAERLGSEGFDCRAVISNFTLGSARAFDQGFASMTLERAGPGDTSSDEVARLAIEQLRGCADGERPFFLLAEFADPNPDFQRQPETDFDAEAATLRGGESLAFLQVMTADMADGEVRALEDLYDGEVRHTDAAIARLLAELERLGLASSTLVVAVSSHGVELFDRGWIGQAHGLRDELTRVPLLLRLPGRLPAGVRPREAASLVSIAPTVLAVLGLPSAADAFDGPALVPAAPLEAGGAGGYLPAYLEIDLDPAYGAPGRVAHQRAVVAQGFKLVRDQSTGVLELFDLVGDPGETRDLIDERPAVLARLRADLERAFGPPPGA